MEEINEEGTEETLDDIAWSPHVITIVIDEYSDYPRVDLGDIPRHAAYVLLKQAAEAVYMTLGGPNIVSNGELIYEWEFSDEDDYEI